MSSFLKNLGKTPRRYIRTKFKAEWKRALRYKHLQTSRFKTGSRLQVRYERKTLKKNFFSMRWFLNGIALVKVRCTNFKVKTKITIIFVFASLLIWETNTRHAEYRKLFIRMLHFKGRGKEIRSRRLTNIVHSHKLNDMSEQNKHSSQTIRSRFLSTFVLLIFSVRYIFV